MTLEDLRTPDGLTPWWPWLLYLAMALGLIIAGGIYARQSNHIAMNRVTAQDMIEVKAEVVRLRERIEASEVESSDQDERIGTVEDMVIDRP